MEVSACIITKNEEENIKKCIESVIAFSDEVIVVDTGSTDNTVDICNELGAEVFYYKWNNDFSAAKNYALSKAKGKWIIFLDSDEYVSSESISSLENLFKTDILNKYNSVSCKMINIDKDNGRTIDEVFKIRIFKNKDIYYEGKIHEHLVSKKGKIEVLNLYNEIIIYHTGYSSSIAKIKAKRNLDMLLANLTNTKEDSKYYAYISSCYFGLRDFKNSIKYARMHINSGIIINGLESTVYKNIIDSLYSISASKEDIEKEIRNAIKKFPNSPNFYVSYANYYLGDKQYEKALYNFLLALKYNVNYNSVDINLVRGIINQIYEKVAQIYEIKNDYSNALNYYYKSLKSYKYEERVFISICNILRKENTEDIIIFLNGIYDKDNEKDLKFLSYNIIEVGLPKLYSYYAIKYLDKNNNDYLKIFLMIFNNKFQKAYEELYFLYEKYYDKNVSFLLVVSVLVSNDKDYIERVSNIVKPSLKRILKMYLRELDIELVKEDLNDYINILKLLINIDKGETLDKYLSIKLSFNIDVNLQLANVFKNKYMFINAIEVLEPFTKSSNEEEKKNIYFGLGYCHYKNNDYKKANNYFQKALKCGYNEKDIYQFVKWIEEI